MRKKYKEIRERIIEHPEANAVKEQLSLIEIYRNNLPTIKTGEITVYIGDVIKSLRLLPENFVDCVVTSPPYWKQRDYKNSQQIGQENTYQEYIKNLIDVFNEMKRVLKSTGTFFLNVGYKYYKKELLLIPEMLAIELQKNGWTLLNKIVWYKPNAMPSSLDSRFSNVYEPIFLFVKEQSKYKYYLSIDELRIPANNFENEKKPEDILGFEVENSLSKNKKIKGNVTRIFKDGQNNIFAEVEWEDGKKTFKIVNNFDKESQLPVKLICPDCGMIIENEIDLEKHTHCKGFPEPILPQKPDFSEAEELKTPSLFYSTNSTPKHSGVRHYRGKFSLNPENRGASPGARKSLFGEYLVVQRRYRIIQPIIANYLRYWREKRGISTKEIDRLLGYKDTAGHWFRTDTGSWGRGGSIPLPDCWFKLKNILKFDDLYDNWVSETHLVLQTVRAHPKGKNPGDVWTIKLQQNPLAHFATFPEELVRRCIKAGCSKEGIVLDPFAGSGTTGKVSQELGMNAILIELVQKYLSIIEKRCKNIREVIYVK